MRKIHLLSATLLLTSGLACGDDTSGTDSGPGVDSGRSDTGGGIDSGSLDSGGGTDSGSTDSGRTDGGAADAGTDSGPELPTAAATVSATGETDSTISGTITYTQDGTEVTVVYELENCPDGDHPTHIHQGMGCENRGAQGMHWGPARGESIPDITCADGTGTVSYTRDASDADTTWTIGGPAETNIVGHAVVIHGAEDNGDRIGCGVVEMR